MECEGSFITHLAGLSNFQSCSLCYGTMERESETDLTAYSHARDQCLVFFLTSFCVFLYSYWE